MNSACMRRRLTLARTEASTNCESSLTFGQHRLHLGTEVWLDPDGRDGG